MYICICQSAVVRQTVALQRCIFPVAPQRCSKTPQQKRIASVRLGTQSALRKSLSTGASAIRPSSNASALLLLTPVVGSIAEH